MSEHDPHNPDQHSSGPEANEGGFSRAIRGIMNFVRKGVNTAVSAGASAGNSFIRFLKDQAGIPVDDAHGDGHGSHGEGGHDDHGTHGAHGDGHDEHGHGHGHGDAHGSGHGSGHDEHGSGGEHSAHGEHGAEHGHSNEHSPDKFEKKYNQWTLAANDNGYNIFNKGEDGKKAFYEIKNGEQYGNPIVTVEPDRAFDAPSNPTYVDAKGVSQKPSEKISGIICEDGPRFSLSSKDAPHYEVAADGTITIGTDKWHLATLFSKDKNRFINYDAYFSKQKPPKVQMLELGDLPLYKKVA